MKNRTGLHRFWIQAILILMTAACQARGAITPNPQQPSGDIRMGSPHRVSPAGYVFEPHIAVDRTNARHVAAVVIASPEFDCDFKTCLPRLVVSTSTDAGATWQEQIPFPNADGSGDGVVGFGPDGTLYVVGLATSPFGAAVVLNQASPGQELTSSNVRTVTNLVGNDKPWLTIDPTDGTLYVAYTGVSNNYEEAGIQVVSSLDNGLTWSAPILIGPTVRVSDVPQKENIPVNGQVVLGENGQLAVVWMWSPGHSLPVDIWMAASTDKGKTFSTPRTIAQTWGFFSTAFHNGTYYLVYRSGTQHQQALTVASSRDGGTNWTVASIDTSWSPYWYPDKAPGVNTAPNGTLDMVFYAYGKGAPECIDTQAIHNRVEGLGTAWVDGCVYDIYYTFSKDGGQTFQPPLKLNTTPIIGSRFTRRGGVSSAGEYIGMASTNEYAYPIWIDTQGAEGTQALTLQIER